MAKKPTLLSIVSGFFSNTTLNTNLQRLRDAFDNTLSLDGSTPNAMQADLDMDGNDILNAGEVRATTLKLNGSNVTSVSTLLTMEGPWQTATAYEVNDIVTNSGSGYIVKEAHTSGTFSTDLAAGKLELLVEGATPGAAVIDSDVTVDDLLTFPTQTAWNNQFDGDNSLSPIQVNFLYDDATANPFGTTGTSYLYAPHISPVFINVRVNDGVGWNNTTDQNGPGRTGVTAQRVRVSHAGQGDAACYNGSMTVSGAKAGATSWLANPAGVLFNGDIQALASGVYLNPFEILMQDNNFDAAGIGIVLNLERDNSTGALSAGWDGIRLQSRGTDPVDSGVRIDGTYDVGVNLSRADVTDNAAIALKANQRVYLNAASDTTDFGTTLSNTYIHYNSSTGTIDFTQNGELVLQLAGTGIITRKAVRIQNGGTILSGSGAPNGSVTAPVGSMWLRTDGGAGSTLYVKESGTGNTGWVAK